MKKRLLASFLSLCLILTAVVTVNPYPVAAEASSEIYSNVIAGGEFETEEDLDLWTVRNQHEDQVVCIDQDNGHNSKGSLKIDMVSDYYESTNVLYLLGKTVDGAEDSFDTTAKYVADMDVKTSEDFKGSVYLRLRQGSSYINVDSSPDLLMLGSKDSGVSGCDNWMRIKTSEFALKNQAVQILLYVNGTGTIWIEDFNLSVNNELLVNGGFESNTNGWNNWGSLDSDLKSVSVSKDVTCLSGGSLKLSSTADGVLYMASTAVAVDPNKQYVLSLDVKTDGVGSEGAFGRIYQNYTDESGNTAQAFLVCRSSNDAFKTGGTADWTHYDIKLSGFESTLQSFYVMLYLSGTGTVYYDNVSITERTKPAAAEGEVVADVYPGTVDPNTCVTLFAADGYDIYYTVDGTNPTTSETALLHNPNYGIYITEDTEIRACAVSKDGVGKVCYFSYTCAPLLEDDVLWSDKSSADVSLDGSVRMSGGNSIKISGSGGTDYISTNDIPIDSTFDYKLEFWVKTENLSDGSNAFVNVFLPGDGSLQNTIDGRGGTYVKTQNIIEGIKGTQNWTRYELYIDDLQRTWEKIFITAGVKNDSGSLWIDGVKLTALPYEYYPLSVTGDGAVFGNNYYVENLTEDYTVNQGFAFSNNTDNDTDSDTVIEEGNFDISVSAKSSSNHSVTLNSCNAYGTYTVDFYAEQVRGHEYHIGSVKIAVINDASDVNSDSIYGLNSSTYGFDQFKSMGISMMRRDFYWKTAEPTQGEYVFSDYYENYVDYCNDNGIDAMLILGDGDGPSWFKPGDSNRFPQTDEEIVQFVSYAVATVEHFKGRVKYYEIYNEADWNTTLRVDGKTYANLLNAVYPAIKAADPDAVVVAGATSLIHGDWAAEVFKYAPDSMDYWSCHPYANPKSPEDRSWVESIEYLQDLARQNAGRTIPFLLTELGWSNNESSDGVAIEDQAKWLPRIIAFADTLDYVHRVLIYNDFCNYGGNKYLQEARFGMFDSSSASDGYAHPSVATIANYANMTFGYTFSERQELASVLYVFKYTSDTKATDLYMVWTNDVELKGSFTLSGGNAAVFDMFGNKLCTSVNNSFSADIGGEPIYFTLDEGQTLQNVILSDRVVEVPNGTQNAVVVEEFDTAHSGIADIGRSVDTSKAYSGESSFKIDLSTSRYPNFGKPGAKFILKPDMSQLDVNQKYRLRLSYCSDNQNISFKANMRFYGTDSGKTLAEAWNIHGFDDFLLLDNVTIGTNWTEYTTSETFMPFGNDFYIEFFFWTETDDATGNVWVDKVELIPVDDGCDDGVVIVTGYDTNTGSAVYTAYANDGFTVDNIVATAYSGTTPVYLDVNELSRSADDKTVEFEVSGLGDYKLVTFGNTNGWHMTTPSFDARYITVSFGSEKPIIMNVDDKYIVSDFEEDALDNYGNCTSVHYGTEGTRSYSSSDGYSELAFYLDANTVHKFDASNNYKLSAVIKSTADWQGAIQLSAYSLMGNKTVTLRSDLWVGEYDLLGNYNSTYVTPGTSWSEYTIPNDQMLPITGGTVKLVLRIQRTSSSGTVYIDDVALSPNGYTYGVVKAVDYQKQHGYVKSSYDYVNDKFILIPTAFDGYEYDDMTVNYRAVGGMVYEGVEYANSFCTMQKQLKEIKSVRELSFAVDTPYTSDGGEFSLQSHAYLGIFCTASFKAAAAGVMGDANEDDSADLLDLVRLKKYLADNSTKIRIINIDYNSTGKAEAQDLVTLKKQLLGIYA